MALPLLLFLPHLSIDADTTIGRNEIATGHAGVHLRPTRSADVTSSDSRDCLAIAGRTLLLFKSKNKSNGRPLWCIGPSILNALHLKLKALAEVATVPLPSGEQLSSLFRTLGFDAPFLGAGDQHRGMESP